jgi:hypothetical protein
MFICPHAPTCLPILPAHLGQPEAWQGWGWSVSARSLALLPHMPPHSQRNPHGSIIADSSICILLYEPLPMPKRASMNGLWSRACGVVVFVDDVQGR